MSEIVNRQRKIKIDSQKFEKFLNEAINMIPETLSKSVSVAFVSDRKMIELNRMFRHQNSTTDVLSFPVEGEFSEKDFLGDVVISADQAARQAKENKLKLEREITQLILHGILHLCGYDHEKDSGEMNRLELRLRDKLRIS